jgi:hypothetical protein
MEGSWLLPSWPESGDNANRELNVLVARFRHSLPE